ncbi:MAG: FtsX-like permease family protein [Syntrophobacter sp.]
MQSFSTLLSMAISVGILFALYMFYLGVSSGLETGTRRLGADILVVPADAWVEPEAVLFTGAPMNMYMDAGFAEIVSKIPGVRWVNAQFFTQSLNAECCSLASATRLIGFDRETDRLIPALLHSTRKSEIAPDEILIGAKIDGYSGLQALVLNSVFRVAAVLEPTGTSLDYSILMPIESARKLAKARENKYLRIYWERYGSPDHLISTLLVEVDEDHSKEEVARSIRSLRELKVIETTSVLKNIKTQMQSLFVILLGGGALAMISSILNLFARFFCMAWDRKGEWGLYRALGATRSDLRILIIGEAFSLGTGGALIGVLLGYGLYQAILTLLRNQKAFPFIEPSLSSEIAGILGTAVIFSVIGIISAWFPAYQSGKIEPSAAMGLEDID